MPTDELTEALKSLNLNDSNVEKGRFGESYLVDPETGNKYILPTKRPDGTFRKHIKIRPGYLPPEERQVYVPLHRRNTNKPKDDNFSKPQESKPNDNENSSAVRLSKKPLQQTTTYGSKQSSNPSQYKNNTKSSQQSKQNNDKDQVNFNLANSLKNLDEFPSLGSSDQKQEDASSFNEKKLKNSINNTLKKIREVKMLQNKLKNGADLDPNQLKKVNRMPELEQRLKELKLMDRWELK